MTALSIQLTNTATALLARHDPDDRRDRHQWGPRVSLEIAGDQGDS